MLRISHFQRIFFRCVFTGSRRQLIEVSIIGLIEENVLIPSWSRGVRAIHAVIIYITGLIRGWSCGSPGRKTVYKQNNRQTPSPESICKGKYVF